MGHAGQACCSGHTIGSGVGHSGTSGHSAATAGVGSAIGSGISGQTTDGGQSGHTGTGGQGSGSGQMGDVGWGGGDSGVSAYSTTLGAAANSTMKTRAIRMNAPMPDANRSMAAGTESVLRGSLGASRRTILLNRIRSSVSQSADDVV